MKNLIFSRFRVLTFLPAHALATLLLAAVGLPTRADTNFTSTAWLQAVPLPGIRVTNCSGLVCLKGNAHVVRLESDNQQFAGRLQASLDLAYQADGTARFSGPAYVEVGTWDSAGTNFTLTGGVWSLNCSGVTQADGSSQYNMAGYGIGGKIEGLRLSGTAKRAAPGGPNEPYLISGTIKAAPVNTRVVIDDFADNHFIWPAYGVGPVGYSRGTFFACETNQQLTIGGLWTNTTSPWFIDAAAWADLEYHWAVSVGQTIEARVDVLSLSPTAVGIGLGLWHTDTSGQAYLVGLRRDSLTIGKELWGEIAFFRMVPMSIRDTNLVLSLSLTPVGENVILTGKVLDKANGVIMAQVVAVDTPASDPTLSSSELADLTGEVWSAGIGTDPIAPPFTSGVAPLISVHQPPELSLEPVFATFDNLELHTYELPQVVIEPAVRLSWPKTGMNFVVEEASSPEGPCLPIQNLELPDMQYCTVPANSPKGFFHLQQAP